MRKVYDSASYVSVIYPEKTNREQIAVTEICRAEPPEGHEIRIERSSSALLFYIFSGSCIFKGVQVETPAVIVSRPGEGLEVSVGESCRIFWIKCCGDMARELLSDAGLFADERVHHIDCPEKALAILERLTNEECYAGEDDGLYTVGALFRLLSLHSGRQPKKEAGHLSPYTRTILEHIHENYNEQISERTLAALVNLSTNYMHKIFLSDMKMTPIYYLNFHRMKQAKRMLCETDLSISAIAEAVGISGGDYFCRVFRKYNDGRSPTEYRKWIRSRSK